MVKSAWDVLAVMHGEFAIIDRLLLERAMWCVAVELANVDNFADEWIVS